MLGDLASNALAFKDVCADDSKFTMLLFARIDETQMQSLNVSF